MVVWRSARESRARASERSRPQAITLAIMESNCGGMTSPGATPVSTLMPGPVGRARCSIRPGAGAKSRSGSSAVSRASMACPKAGGSAEPVSASVPPAAMCSCSLTMSTPVVASVTGCSTCNRVLTSRNDSSRSLGCVQELHRPGVDVPGGPDQFGGVRAQQLLLLGVQRGRGGLLDDLLVAPLHAAVPDAQRPHGALGVGDDLNLDVPAAADRPLQEDRRVPGRLRRLGAGALERLVQLRQATRTSRMPRPPPPAVALTISG